MLCKARIVQFSDIQYFGDGKHRFYFESRCNRVCNDTTCADCSTKNPSSRTQYSRTFNHGLITEPIPEESHIYGGKRYLDNVKKWGEPDPHIIKEAERRRALIYEKQSEATSSIAAEEYKVMSRISSETAAIPVEDMPKKASKMSIPLIDTIPLEIISVDKAEKKVRKRPQVSAAVTNAIIAANAAAAAAAAALSTAVEEKQEDSLVEEKQEDILVEEKQEDILVEEKQEDSFGDFCEKSKKSKKPEKPKKPRAPRKSRATKKAETPYETLAKSALANSSPSTKEVCIPTHIEKTLDVYDADGYEIEYVRLTKFEHEGVKYFRDMKKQKLYQRVKDSSVGKYVGRYDSYSDSVIEDVPDSDADA